MFVQLSILEVLFRTIVFYKMVYINDRNSTTEVCPRNDFFFLFLIVHRLFPPILAQMWLHTVCVWNIVLHVQVCE